ncbi:hypothetical protein DB30_08009 [Enhygromyxa salina]|uniref:Outer membrane lipoprotein carrier protein LolA n=1 Tax=Enhygromyxa salina TaxID=215803 RepID=A0A0C2D022_9BACT|nr:hypothetical protein [Enhygromyxa salina]KIG13497.1 hypothetical protein DB30_08009 [Enhygromyxa salina]
MSRVSRRGLLISGASGLALLGAALATRAAPAEPVSRDQRRLDNRLELWGAFARKSQNLVARYTSTRSSPLLLEDLVGSGSLAYVSPTTLVMRDDGATGSTTRIEPSGVAIVPNDPSLPQRPMPKPANAPALRWLADRLVASFAPGDGSALIANARVEVPKGSTPRLSLLPPRDSVARTLIRSVTLTLDQVGGAVIRVEVAESDGGKFILQISDHRQNVEPELIARVLD